MQSNIYNAEAVGKRIKNARKALNYTQAQTAEMINMSSKNFSQLERGMTGMSVNTIVSLCKVLNVSADYILFGCENFNSNGVIGNIFAQLSENDRLYAERILSVFAEHCKR